MVSNNDIYSKLQSYKNELDNYIEDRKKHPDDLRASPAFDSIFKDIRAINGLQESTAALTSEAARIIFPTPATPATAPDQNKVLKREIRQLNKSIVSAKYQSEIQGLNWLQKIPVWFKYHFSSPEKLGIARLDVRHLVDLMKAANVKTDAVVATKLTQAEVNTDSEAISQLNDVVQKLGGQAADGTYLLLKDKSGLYIIETKDNQSKFTKYTFKDENGLCAVFDNHKNRVGTFTDRESFLKQKQIDAAIAYIKDPKITVEPNKHKYIQIETGRTKEGKEITLILKNSEGLVATNQYILPNGITSGTSSYFNKEEFFQAKAKELHIPYVPSTVGSDHAEVVDTVETARRELQGKPVGTWTRTFPNEKSEAVFLVVADSKNTIKEFTYKEMQNKAPEAIRPFLEAPTTTRIPNKEVVSFIPISAQQKRIAQGEALRRLIVGGVPTQSNLREAMIEADKATPGKSSFVVKAVDGKNLTEFTLLARPTGVDTFDSNRIIKVLPDGRVQHGEGRIFENFEAYKASELLSTSLPEALIKRHLGAPLLKAPTNLPANTYAFWADKIDTSKLYLSNKTATGIETYQIGNMKFDDKGEATFQLQSSKGTTLTVKQSSLAKPFGDAVLSLQQRDVVGRLSQLVAKDRIEKNPSELIKEGFGYLLTPTSSNSAFTYKVVDATGLIRTSEEDYTLRVLPDGKINLESKAGKVEHFSDMTTFQSAPNGLADKKSIKDLAHFDKVGAAIAKEIKQRVEDIMKPVNQAWPQNESEARALMDEAKTLELPQNLAVFVRQGSDSSRITILCHKNGELVAIPADVQQNGKLIVTAPESTLTTTYDTIEDVLKANGLVKADTILKQIEEKRKIIQEGVNKLKATNGFDSSNTAASRITDELTSHIEEFPSMDKMVGAWMLAEVVEITPPTWFFQSETVKETGRFKLAVNVGDKEEDMKIVEHTVSVNSKGQFVVDNDATKPKNSVEEVLSSVGANKKLSLGELKTTEAKWNSVEESIKTNKLGLYVSEENIDLKQVWENEYKAQGAAIITDIGTGEFSISGKDGLSVDFSTREYPGKLVILPLGQPPKIYDDIGALVASEVGPSKPWLLEHQEKLAEKERNAPKEPGFASQALNMTAAAGGALWRYGWNFISGGNQTAPVAEPVAVRVDRQSPKMQQQPAASPSPQPQQAAKAQQELPAQPQVQNAAIPQALSKMKPSFMNGDKYYKFKGQTVVKAQKALMKELITWKNANTALSAQDAKAALKMLLLNDNYEQSQGFNTLEDIQALALDIIPAPAGVNKNARNEALEWLWEASKK